MSVELVVGLVLGLLAVAGTTAGVVVALRSGSSHGRTAPTDHEEGLLRVSAQIHTGWEQSLIGVLRELGLPRDRAGIGYGQLYLEMQNEHRVFVRTRSEIGRGFVGALDFASGRRFTELRYSILRLPGDEDLQVLVLNLELDLISALRRVDRHANVQLAAEALRDLGRPVRPGRAPASAGE